MKTAEEWEEIATKDLVWRSPSQLNEYERCPYAYYLNRRARAWKRPAAWLAHGSAVHKGIELWEQASRQMEDDEVVRLAQQTYRDMINLELKENPNTRQWFSSGPYGGAKDIPRRAGVVADHVLNVLSYYRKHPDEKPWVDPEGHMWVEKEFKVKFGDVEVVGFVDVVVDAKPRDYKTGTNPGDDSQLATYAGVLNLKFGTPFTTADYFMAKRGTPTRPYDLSSWSIGRLTDAYGELDENIKAERFDPNPSPEVCGRCPVSTSCEFAQIG